MCERKESVNDAVKATNDPSHFVLRSSSDMSSVSSVTVPLLLLMI